MRIILLITLLASIAKAHVDEQGAKHAIYEQDYTHELVDKLVGKLVKPELTTSLCDREVLFGTTLGKVWPHGTFSCMVPHAPPVIPSHEVASFQLRGLGRLRDSMIPLERQPRVRTSHICDTSSAQSCSGAQFPEGTALQCYFDMDFKEMVIDSPVPVLLDFWAPWCGPCKVLDPVMDEIASEYAGKIRVIKVNAEAFSAMAKFYQVKSLPTISILGKGEALETLRGVVAKEKLIESINKFL